MIAYIRKVLPDIQDSVFCQTVDYITTQWVPKTRISKQPCYTALENRKKGKKCLLAACEAVTMHVYRARSSSAKLKRPRSIAASLSKRTLNSRLIATSLSRVMPRPKTNALGSNHASRSPKRLLLKLKEIVLGFRASLGTRKRNAWSR